MEIQTYYSDMPTEKFKEYAEKLVNWITGYLENIEDYKVLPDAKPGEVYDKLPENPPKFHRDFDELLNDIESIITPNLTHWNHPGFMAYFNSTSSKPGILAEFLSAAFNINGMLWKTSPAFTELELKMTDWFRQMVGLPASFKGIIYDTASVSSMHAIAAARENTGLDIRQRGMAGRKDLPPLVLYASEQAHNSIDKGALTLGVGLEGIRKIPVDNKFRMIPERLQYAIDEDRAKGFRPFCVVATVGTTSATSIDPVPEIAAICEKENLWLHIDSAYAGVSAILPEMKWITDGWEKADSIVINPHKWMFTPVDLSILFCRKPEILKKAFSLSAEYLKTTIDQEVINLMDYGIQLGRRFRSLKLFFIINYFGVEGLAAIIRSHIKWAKELSEWIKADKRFELMAPVIFGTICFRANPEGNDDEELNLLNENLLEEINKTGRFFLSHTRLNDKYVIRINIGSINHEKKHLVEVWNLIKEKLDMLTGN
ncbi:MAG: pyridoxal-dependent decarboxylase [Ignavibacteriaceae bacterium]